MTIWLATTLGLLPPLLLAVIAAGRKAAGARLLAVELATSLATFLLIAMSFLFDQASAIDLALALALLTLPGTLLFCMFEERWL